MLFVDLPGDSVFDWDKNLEINQIFPGPMLSFPKMENMIGSVVEEV